jgi:hypothetical protein
VNGLEKGELTNAFAKIFPNPFLSHQEFTDSVVMFKVSLTITEDLNTVWSMDFTSDALANGGRIKVLNIVDEYNKEALTIYPNYSISTVSMISPLEILEQRRVLPESFINNQMISEYQKVFHRK